MTTALILSLADNEAGLWLSAIRQLADEDSRSEPHITVRYPIQRIDRAAISSSRDVVVSSAVITAPGRFRGRRGTRAVIYLNCSSELLESFSYRPEFPDSVFHLTLYEAEQSDFSERLLALLQEWPWRLRVPLTPPALLREIAVGAKGRASKRSERFTPEVISALALLDPRYGSIDFLQGLNETNRLAAIALVVDRLHSILESVDGHEREATVHVLAHGLTRPQQQLWTSAPVAEPIATREPGSWLDPHAARGGNLVLTPPELVEEMVGFGLKAHRGREIHFGDPALGNGIFFAVLTRVLDERSGLASSSAVEVNRDRANTAAARWSSRGLEVLLGDFLTALPERKWNFVLANPPYVRSQDIDDDIKEFAQSRISESLGLEVPRRANLFTYFLLRCHDWLMPDATSVWLIPADFLETRYGSVLREYLSTRVQLLRIHTHDPHELQFENVRVSPALVAFRNAMPASDHVAVMSRGGPLAKPKEKRVITSSDLALTDNWRLVASGIDRVDRSRPGAVHLGDLFRIRRGIATGANHFFVVDEETAAEHGLEIRALRPLLPRPRYLPKDGVIRADRHGMPKVKPRLFLIDSSDDLETLRRRAPNLGAYLESVPDEVLKGHLVSRRSPFYRQETRLPSELIASNMGQYADEMSAPVRFFLNLSTATVLNNYLVLYPKTTGRESFGPRVARQLFELLQQIDPGEYRIWGREYSGGMYKLEPRDLSRVRISVSHAEALAFLDAKGSLLDREAVAQRT